MTIFSKLADAFRTKELTAIEEFNALAEAAAADDSKIDEKRAFAILQAAGKSASDFEAAVKYIKSKATWREEVEAGKQAAAESQKLETEWAQMLKDRDAEQKSLNEKWNSAIGANEVARRRLQATVSAGERAAGQLAQACADPALTAKLNELTRQWNVVRGNDSPAPGDDFKFSNNFAEEHRLKREIDSVREQIETLAG